jgi:hypothetical protein
VTGASGLLRWVGSAPVVEKKTRSPTTSGWAFHVMTAGFASVIVTVDCIPCHGLTSGAVQYPSKICAMAGWPLSVSKW